MEQTTNLKKHFVFDESFFDVLSEVLKKYNLEESPEKLVKKVETGEKFFSKIFMDVIKSFFKNDLKEEELKSVFINELTLSDSSAINLIKDAKEKIIPLIKEELVQEEKIGIPPQPEKIENNTKSFVKTPQINDEDEVMLKPEVPSIEDLKSNIKKIPTFKKPPTPRKQTSGSDRYREPIE